MRGYRTGPARSRKGCFLVFIFLLPLLITGLSLMFPAAEVIEHYNRLDEERQMELEESGRISTPDKRGVSKNKKL